MTGFSLGFISYSSAVPGAIYGYSVGGISTAIMASTDRTTFSTGVTAANTVSNVATAGGGGYGSAISDKTTYGYNHIGYDSAYSTKKIVEKITFSTGIFATNTASDLSVARVTEKSLSDGATYGYFAGGNTGATVATADRITFSTSATAANTASNLSASRMDLGAVSGGQIHGYGLWLGGLDSGSTKISLTNKITFSTGVTATNTANTLSAGRANLPAVYDGVSYGYTGGGLNTANNRTKVSDKITFSTGAIAANTSSDLSTNRSDAGGFSDGYANGYFCGGYTPGRVNTSDIIVFSTGITSANTVSNLSVAKWYHSSFADLAI